MCGDGISRIGHDHHLGEGGTVGFPHGCGIAVVVSEGSSVTATDICSRSQS